MCLEEFESTLSHSTKLRGDRLRKHRMLSMNTSKGCSAQFPLLGGLLSKDRQQLSFQQRVGERSQTQLRMRQIKLITLDNRA